MTDFDFTDLVDLAAERLGGAVLLANDEFFAPKEALLRAGPAEWREGEYTERGKWMDGWETRRRRTPGHDWCIVRLGLAGVVRGVVVDTSYFRGNFPESCTLDGAEVSGTPDLAQFASDPSVIWSPILARSPLAGDSRNMFVVSADRRVTHLLFSIFPDGGVARLRVHGDALPDSAILRPGREVDLAALENGGFVEVCSDMFFGHRQNLIMPGRSTHMGDGWETKRRRGPGHDWTIVRLARRGLVERVELDTDHYKGNAPASVMLEWCDAAGASAATLSSSTSWHELVPNSPVQPHARHRWSAAPGATATHVRLSIYPDGGIARLRLFGTPDGTSTAPGHA
ncbi:MAG: allantoicase [Gemmatimonadales bacterium]